MRAALVLLALAANARAVELHIQFGALERMLSEQVFTQEGRRYNGINNFQRLCKK